jgi:hypothetical protein
MLKRNPDPPKDNLFISVSAEVGDDTVTTMSMYPVCFIEIMENPKIPINLRVALLGMCHMVGLGHYYDIQGVNAVFWASIVVMCVDLAKELSKLGVLTEEADDTLEQIHDWATNNCAINVGHAVTSICQHTNEKPPPGMAKFVEKSRKHVAKLTAVMDLDPEKDPLPEEGVLRATIKLMEGGRDVPEA